MPVSTEEYEKFANSLLSNPSHNLDEFVQAMIGLHATGVNAPMLLNAAIGLTGEAGEVADMVKKMVFQGKPFSEEQRIKLVHELGDVMWYLATAATALGVSFDVIMVENMSKLKARYPNGFEVNKSENR